MAILSMPVKDAGGVYKRYSMLLEKLGIVKFEDFLYHIPFRYNDYSLVSKISKVQPGEIVTVRGKVKEIKNEYMRGYKKLQKAKVSDDTGVIDVIWFNQPYITKTIKENDYISLSGKAENGFGTLTLQSPEYEMGDKDFIHTGRLVPVYPETRGVSSKWLRRQVHRLLSGNGGISDYLPQEIIEENDLIDISNAIEKVHFPKNLEEAEIAKKRLAFDELFLMQASGILRKKDWEENLSAIPFNIKKYKKEIDSFIDNLPFKLTSAQENAVSEIFEDFEKDKPMNRLLEGDVGSGKTVVAAISMYVSFLNGYQSVIMAPTEILALQHYNTIVNLLSPYKIKVALATGSKKKDLSKEFSVLVGTHAVTSEKVKFKKLGLVVIDEQQRFGVEQRSLIRKKGKNPHVLTMTATPIPRTIALTLYGDLSLSYLDEMPQGRKKVITWLVPNTKREGAYEWIKKEIKNNQSQAFIICPFIEESETLLTVKAATKEFEHLSKNVFKDLKLSMLHGKLKPKEKEAVLSDFKDKKFDILVATPVVEVGIDISNATIILIEGSERFGLAQLHQLRGRVGRGDKQSYCLLFTETPNPLTSKRLKSMETLHVGADLAELDLRLRGPGQLYGTKQHGVAYLKIANFSDFDLIKKTKEEAEKIMQKIEKYPILQKKLKEINTEEVSPD